jgi:hypothetical protein
MASSATSNVSTAKLLIEQSLTLSCISINAYLVSVTVVVCFMKHMH